MSEIFLTEPGPPGLFAVFEDNDETGYLYLYQEEAADEESILGAIHVYDKTQCPDVTESDIKIGWKEDIVCFVTVGDVYRELQIPSTLPDAVMASTQPARPRP